MKISIAQKTQHHTAAIHTAYAATLHRHKDREHGQIHHFLFFKVRLIFKLYLSQKVESHSGTETRPLTFRDVQGMPRIIEAVLPDISHICRLQNGHFIVQGFTEHHSLKKGQLCSFSQVCQGFFHQYLLLLVNDQFSQSQNSLQLSFEGLSHRRTTTPVILVS